MSNVHGFGNFSNNNRQPNPGYYRGGQGGQPPPGQPGQPDDNDPNILGGFGQPVMLEQLQLAEQHKVLFVSGRRSLKDPRQQHYWDMLVFALCPNFEFISITFLLVLADIAVFIYEDVIGLDSTSSNLLQVQTSVLINHGGSWQPAQLSGQVYRFLSAIFLHVNFMHIFGNVITTFMFVSRIQYTYGWVKTIIVYLLSGIAANVFSALINPAPVKAGASTSLFGIIGIIIGYIIINWNGLDLFGAAIKCQIWCTAFFVIIFIFIFTPSDASNSIDYWGHFGGFLAGLWLSSIHQTIVNFTREKVFRIVFASLFVIQVVICFAVFYTTQTPGGS